jgi:alpha-ketoglutarate-dependent taurine dioxygenase
MSSKSLGKARLAGLGVARRKAVSVSSSSLVDFEPLDPGTELPLLVRPAGPGVDLAGWAASSREAINQHLSKHGAILFRGFGLSTAEDFHAAVQALSGDLLEYKERSSPRSAVHGKIYTSTDYPPDQPIFLHNENSYQQTWPMKIFFFCRVPAAKGGETPIADVRKIYLRIHPEIRQRLMKKKWSYVRNFGDGFGLSWQTVFQTDDKANVEAYCGQNGIVCEWKDGNRLRTRAVRPVAVRHPESDCMVWFNHATFFHVSTLTEPIREALLQEFSEEDLPANSYYGDGTPIEAEVLDHLRSLYEAETVRFPWQRGDLLMLDNMKVAHGRAPFEGSREILVGMADPCSWDRFEA